MTILTTGEPQRTYSRRWQALSLLALAQLGCSPGTFGANGAVA